MPFISGNFFLSKSQQENNAQLICDYFVENGWTKNAIAAMLGNMQSESSINPGIWENLTPNVGGYGLVQWTPYTKYANWAGAAWKDNGYRECERIQYEMENGLQWGTNPTIEKPNPPITFEQFSKSHDDPRRLANYFLWYYERPGNPKQPWRAKQAWEWFSFIGGHYIPIWLLDQKRRGKPYV